MPNKNKDKLAKDFRKKQKKAVEEKERQRKEGVKASSRFSKSALEQ
ncbi:MAG TPA: hypothetical protein VI978_01100 [Candidatus Paceibacterota bacterium]